MENLLGLVMVINTFWDWVVAVCVTILVVAGGLQLFCLIVSLCIKLAEKLIKRGKNYAKK